MSHLIKEEYDIEQQKLEESFWVYEGPLTDFTVRLMKPGCQWTPSDLAPP